MPKASTFIDNASPQGPLQKLVTNSKPMVDEKSEFLKIKEMLIQIDEHKRIEKMDTLGAILRQRQKL